MPARTPLGRASYDAAVTTPRRPGSPHTITGCPRRCGWCACSTEAKNASMSTSRITARASLGFVPGPRSIQDPARPARVVGQLVGVGGVALDREALEHRGSLAAAPFA